MTAPIVITGIVVLSVVIFVCTLIALVSRKSWCIDTEWKFWLIFQGFCLWPVIQEVRKNKRLKEKQSNQGSGLEHYNHGYSWDPWNFSPYTVHLWSENSSMYMNNSRKGLDTFFRSMSEFRRKMKLQSSSCSFYDLCRKEKKRKEKWSFVIHHQRTIVRLLLKIFCRPIHGTFSNCCYGHFLSITQRCHLYCSSFLFSLGIEG